MKKQDAVKWAVSKLGQRITLGQPYGAQCAVFVIAFLKEKFGVHPTGNAIDFLDYKYPKGFQVIRYDKSKPHILQPGDIAVFGGNKYGHIVIVTEANAVYFNAIEQNWYNANLTVGSPAALVEDHVYDNLVGIIRPPYEDTVQGPAHVATKINTLNQTINYQMANRGGAPKGVVIHNTAGASTALQDYNSLRNAGYNRYAAGIAHYYIDRNTVWRAIDTFSVAWHTASTDGNVNYIGYEVNESLNASNVNFLANEQATFKKAALDMLYYGLPVNRNTVRLHCEFVPTACPHRSMTIHTGWDPTKQGAAPQYIVDRLKDYFIDQILKYYRNPALPAGTQIPEQVTTRNTKPAATPTNKAVSNPKKLTQAPTGWKVNKYGIRWRTESGSFTCTADQGIYTRFTGPGREYQIAGLLRKGETVRYNEKQINDGHLWISWETYGGETVYMPIATYDIKTGKAGTLWGTLK